MAIFEVANFWLTIERNLIWTFLRKPGKFGEPENLRNSGKFAKFEWRFFNFLAIFEIAIFLKFYESKKVFWFIRKCIVAFVALFALFIVCVLKHFIQQFVQFVQWLKCWMEFSLEFLQFRVIWYAIVWPTITASSRIGSIDI